MKQRKPYGPARTKTPAQAPRHRGARPSDPAAEAYKRGERVTGVFQGTLRGFGFVVPDKGGRGDIKIPIAGVGAALHGDRVQAEVQRAPFGEQPSGAIAKILKHANELFVGRISHRGKYSVVIPKNPKLNRTLEVMRKLDPALIPDGAWIVAEVTRWSDSPRDPLTGRVHEVLGVEGDKGLPILLLIRGAGVPDAFSAKVVGEADALLKHPDDNDPARRDFRRDRIVTIDPATAKDFDDAVGIIEAGAFGWRVGVHIADVAHFVRPGTALDDEAYARATSIYPVDRVIPMLPEALSNGLCSLRQDEDKLTMSALFTITPDGELRDIDLCNSRIRSARRFAYEEVQAFFDAEDKSAGVEVAERKAPLPLPEIAPGIAADLRTLRAASRALSKARFGRGALDLNLPEPVFVMDAEGVPIAIAHAEHYEAHRLIEELMIAANEAVARELEKRGYPALYRVHDEPKEGRAQELAPALARVGISIPAKGALTRDQLKTILEQAQKLPAARVIQQWILRTLMRARYQPENIGHFGLASASYLHFTSPIRRYPDLIVHRIVKLMLAGHGPESEQVRAIGASLADQGRHCTTREELSQRVEWDAESIIALDYMRRNHLGDVFDAFVAGVNPMGFFVALADYPVEGLVRIASVEDEYYDLDEEYHIWRSRNTGSTIAMGDAISVMIERIDVLAGQMDLRLVRRKEKKEAPSRRDAEGKRGKRR